jgi:hypothetical protein
MTIPLLPTRAVVNIVFGLGRAPSYKSSGNSCNRQQQLGLCSPPAHERSIAELRERQP